jgi:hypothetical protein
MSKLAKELEEIHQSYLDKIYERAEHYRNTVIIPFCEKYGLNYRNVNGYFYFVHIEDDYNIERYCLDDNYKDKDGPKLLKSKGFLKACRNIFEDLNYEISYNDYFGEYVDSYQINYPQ